MNRTKSIKLSLIVCGLIAALWMFTPKVYVHALFSSKTSALNIDPETKVEAPADNADIQEYNKPAYFNIFKFISSFIPLKSKE